MTTSDDKYILPSRRESGSLRFLLDTYKETYNIHVEEQVPSVGAEVRVQRLRGSVSASAGASTPMVVGPSATLDDAHE